MIQHPPKCSAEWTDAERRKLAAFITMMSIDRIRGDDPNMPALAKKPVYELFRSLHFLMTACAELLEENRAAYEKPFDSSQNYHGVLATPEGNFIVQDMLTETPKPKAKKRPQRTTSAQRPRFPKGIR
jgi:hypothetical protein